MNFDAEETRLQEQFRLISVRASPGQLLWSFQKLRQEHENGATSEARRVEIEKEIRELQLRAEAAGHGLSGEKGLSSTTAWLIFAAMVIVAGLFGLYFREISSGNHESFSIAATRPLLVMTLIVSMLGLGGILTVRALLSPEGGKDLQDRFRLAREVFLVFSGIFGTIIGFYFGAATSEGEDVPPAVSLAVDRTILTAQVSGGAEPFIGYVTREGPPLSELMKGSGRLLTLELDPNDCPVEATVVLVDGRGRKATADIERENVSNHPNPSCGQKAVPSEDQANSTSNQTTNGQVTSVETAPDGPNAS